MRLEPEAEAAQELGGGDVFRTHVRLEAVQVELLEGVRHDERQTLAQVPLTRVRRERVVAEECALERAADDLCEIRDAGERLVLVSADEEAGAVGAPTALDVVVERGRRVGRGHPWMVQS